MPKTRREPRITVVCTEELLEQLVQADRALRHSRNPGVRRTDQINAIAVQVINALSKTRRRRDAAEDRVVPAGTKIDAATGAFVLQPLPDGQ